MGSLRAKSSRKAQAKQREAQVVDWQRARSVVPKEEKRGAQNRWVCRSRFNIKCIFEEPPKYTQFEKTHFDEDHGSNNHGWYTLKAVLTHKGRSIDGGHYIAWTKQEDGRWIKFDDDKVAFLFIFILAMFLILGNCCNRRRSIGTFWWWRLAHCLYLHLRDEEIARLHP